MHAWPFIIVDEVPGLQLHETNMMPMITMCTYISSLMLNSSLYQAFISVLNRHFRLANFRVCNFDCKHEACEVSPPYQAI